MSAPAPLLARQSRTRTKPAAPAAQTARAPYRTARADRYGRAASAAAYGTVSASASARGQADTAIPIPSLGGRAGGMAAAASVLDSPRRRVDEPRWSSAPSPLRVGPPPARGHAPRAPFVILLLLLMGGGLMCLLLLNTALAQSAFKVHDLRQTSSDLLDEEQALSMRLDRLSAPATLAARAAQLGMVPGGIPQYLPAGTPIPPGARVIGTDSSSGVVTVVVPPPGRTAAGSVAAGGVPAGGTPTGAAPAGGAPPAGGTPTSGASAAGGSPAGGAR